MRRRAFTLIEVLVVIAIIALLAGFTFGAIQVVGRKNYEAKSKARLERLVTAIEQYKAAYGFYPQQNPSSPSDSDLRLRVSFVESLKKPGKDAMYIDWLEVAYGAGIRQKLGTLSSDQQTYCMDGSEESEDGKPRCFYYRCPGQLNTDTYDLWCKGLDGHHGKKGDGNDLVDAMTRKNTNDDITNWKQK